MKKKLLSLLLCVSIIWGLAPHQAYAKASRDTSFEASLAEDLKSLGLFKGVSETDFDLDRAPSRIEALVMLIRLLGSEQEAIEQHNSHPFTDVPDWADDYVGYAYTNGLANGVTETEFGTGQSSAAMYLTFVLRALGYSDAGGTDFSWDSPYALAERIGVLPETVDVSNFWRADAVSISCCALHVKLKGKDQTLAYSLIDAGIFAESQYKDIVSSTSGKDNQENDVPGSSETTDPTRDTEADVKDSTDEKVPDTPSSDDPITSEPGDKDETENDPNPDEKDDQDHPPAVQPPECEKPDWLDEPYDKPENNDTSEWGEKPGWLDEPYDRPENNNPSQEPDWGEKPDWLKTR